MAALRLLGRLISPAKPYEVIQANLLVPNPNTTVTFTLINTLLLRDLPVREPERLVQLSMLRQDSQLPFSYPMFRELVRGQRVFTGLISWGATGMSNVETNGVLSQSHIQAVTGNWYSELGARLSPFTHHGGIHDSNPLELSA